MLEKFDPDVRDALASARGEAQRLGSDHIGCEHLLLGLLDAARGPAASALAAAGLRADDLRAQLAGGAGGPGGPDDPLDADALAALGIDLDAVRRATDTTFGKGALDRAGRPRADRLRGLRLTRDATTSLGIATRAASGQGSHHITSGHLLLGLTDRPGNTALTALRTAGIDPDALRADVIRRMTTAA